MSTDTAPRPSEADRPAQTPDLTPGQRLAVDALTALAAALVGRDR